MGLVGGGDFVHYRCEETGSMLTVKADENLLDDYVDPVTGCVMTKVDNAGAQVIKGYLNRPDATAETPPNSLSNTPERSGVFGIATIWLLRWF